MMNMAGGDNGVFNVEGGCYAKCIDLTEDSQPEIYRAVRFGAVMENVVVDPKTGAPDFSDNTITENTRVAYPLNYIPNAKIPSRAGHPKNIILPSRPMLSAFCLRFQSLRRNRPCTII